MIAQMAIHESVGRDHPPELLRDELSSDELAVDLVTDSDGPEVLSQYDAIVTLDPRDVFYRSDVEWVHVNSAGIDDFSLEKYEERGITLTNSSGIHSISVGEHVVAMMIMLARQFPEFGAAKYRHEWREPEWDEQFVINGQSVCVLGLGGLGGGIVERADKLGMTVTGVRRNAEQVPHVEKVYTSDSLMDAIESPRFVIIALPLTDETSHLIGREELDRMRDDAYLINVGRGPIVDEEALIDALQNGDIAGAGLDVFSEEPLPEGSPLWDLENVVQTPHCAGGFKKRYQTVAALIKENIDRLNASEEPKNLIV